jgi:hypothetical protein
MTPRTAQAHVLHQQEKGNTMSTTPTATQPSVKKHFTSSILLWVRTDQPRQTGMDYWKGPHSWRNTGRSTSPSTTRACGP